MEKRININITNIPKYNYKKISFNLDLLEESLTKRLS